MSIYNQLKNARDSLRQQAKFVEVFYVSGPDLECNERDWAVEVRSTDDDDTLRAVARGVRRVSEVKVPVH